jgi:hypothetical protein
MPSKADSSLQVSRDVPTFPLSTCLMLADEYVTVLSKWNAIFRERKTVLGDLFGTYIFGCIW